nr:APC/C activator protein CDC20-like [Physcomitrium patens]|eukprot:XP_024402282.1 APC/C activator protein CDC20-like [Physcomitrella patens]
MAKVFHLPTTSDGRRDRCPLSEQLYLQPLSWNSPKSKTPGRWVTIHSLVTRKRHSIAKLSFTAASILHYVYAANINSSRSATKFSTPLSWVSIFVSFKYRCCDLQQSDRFITDRSDMDFNDANYMLAGVEENAVENGNVHSPSKVRSEVLLFTLSSLQLDSTWKGLQSPPEIPPHPLYSLEILSGKLGQNSYSVMMYRNFALNTAPDHANLRAQFRHIPQTAERTLDAPNLLDDNYLNLPDWSATNVLAIALANMVYLWDATTSSIAELLTADEDGPVTTLEGFPDSLSRACMSQGFMSMQSSVMPLAEEAAEAAAVRAGQAQAG